MICGVGVELTGSPGGDGGGGGGDGGGGGTTVYSVHLLLDLLWIVHINHMEILLTHVIPFPWPIKGSSCYTVKTNVYHSFYNFIYPSIL